MRRAHLGGPCAAPRPAQGCSGGTQYRNRVQVSFKQAVVKASSLYERLKRPHGPSRLRTVAVYRFTRVLCHILT